jgi:hypothetical protein
MCEPKRSSSGVPAVLVLAVACGLLATSAPALAAFHVLGLVAGLLAAVLVPLALVLAAVGLPLYVLVLVSVSIASRRGDAPWLARVRVLPGSRVRARVTARPGPARPAQSRTEPRRVRALPGMRRALPAGRTVIPGRVLRRTDEREPLPGPRRVR